jgi:hypothetical protein
MKEIKKTSSLVEQIVNNFQERIQVCCVCCAWCVVRVERIMHVVRVV